MWKILLRKCVFLVIPICIICQQVYVLNKDSIYPSGYPYINLPTPPPYPYKGGYQGIPQLPAYRYQPVNQYVKPVTTEPPSTTTKLEPSTEKPPLDNPKTPSTNPFDAATLDAATKSKATAMMFLSSIELALRQLFLVFPDIFLTLTKSETSPKTNGVAPDKNGTNSRRFFFSTPNINVHNTIVNSNTNSNENNNLNRNSNSNLAGGEGRGSYPYPPGAYPFGPAPFGPGPSEYPLLKFFLESLSKDKSNVDIGNRKPVKICFELS